MVTVKCIEWCIQPELPLVLERPDHEPVWIARLQWIWVANSMEINVVPIQLVNWNAIIRRRQEQWIALSWTLTLHRRAYGSIAVARAGIHVAVGDAPSVFSIFYREPAEVLSYLRLDTGRMCATSTAVVIRT